MHETQGDKPTPLDQYKRYHAEIQDLEDRYLQTYDSRAKRLLRRRVNYRLRRQDQLAVENDLVRQYSHQELARAREIMLADPVLGPMVRAANGG